MGYRQRRASGPSKVDRTPYTKLPDGAVANKHGVIIEPEQFREFQRLVDNINHKHARMMKNAEKLPWLSLGKPTGNSVAQLQLMGHENDVLIAKRSKSMQRFKTQEDFERYLDNLRMVAAPDYIKNKMEAYRERFTDTLSRIYGKAADDIIKHVKGMPINQYMKEVQQIESLQLGYYDSEEDESSPFNPSLDIVRKDMGIPLQDD